MSHHHHHGSDHSHGLSGKKLWWSVVINVLITLAEIIGGIISGSLALLSDALHNFSDVVSLLISYIANKVVKNEADLSKTFGYKRAEIIAAFVNAITLIIIAGFLIKESVARFFEEPDNIQSGIVIVLAFLSIVGNGICALMLFSDSKHNMNIRSSYLHLLTDMYTSVAVLIGGILMKFFGIYWMDSVITLGIGGYLIYVGFDLLKESFKVLMLFSPEHIILEKLVERVNRVEGIQNMHHVHIWSLNEKEIHLEAHLELKENTAIADFDILVQQIEEILYHEFGVTHTIFQPEFKRNCTASIIVQE